MEKIPQDQLFCMSIPWDIGVLKARLPGEMREDAYWDLELSDVVCRFQEKCVPRLVYRIYAEFSVGDAWLEVEGQRLQCGETFAAILEKCSRVVIAVYTIGEEVAALYRQYESENDLLKVYLCDCLANWALDKLVGSFRDFLLRKTGAAGVTFPVSPGCCHFDLREQKALFSLLDASLAGVSLSGLSVMYPQNSVSAVIGLSEKMQWKENECRYCGRKHCIYRKYRNK